MASDSHGDVVQIGTWIQAGKFHLDWALRDDTLSAVMVAMVTTVSTLIHIYSVGYMHHEHRSFRFFAYLELFTFAMLMLVTANNLVQLFFGWEGVGLASYLLIGYWYDRPSACARGDQGDDRQPRGRSLLRGRHRARLLPVRRGRFPDHLRPYRRPHERHLSPVRHELARLSR